jgi:hypothetical protein
MDTSIDNAREETALGAGRALVLWFLFFLISFGLGYPTLNSALGNGGMAGL